MKITNPADCRMAERPVDTDVEVSNRTRRELKTIARLLRKLHERDGLHIVHLHGEAACFSIHILRAPLAPCCDAHIGVVLDGTFAEDGGKLH